MYKDDQPQTTDRRLNQKAKIGNFFDPDLFLPIIALMVFWAMPVIMEILHPANAFVLWIWSCLTYLIVIGKDAWKIFSRLMRVPYDTSAQIRYENKYKIPPRERYDCITQSKQQRY